MRLRFRLRGCLLSLSLLQFCVYAAPEWSPAGFACSLCLVASRSLSLVSVILYSMSPHNLLISRGGRSVRQLSVSVGREQCMVWLRAQQKGGAAEIRPFLPVADSLSACTPLTAICCCINRQSSELEQLAHGPRLHPLSLLSS